MKKIIISASLVCLSILFYGNANAQKAKSFVGIQAGASFPMGNFHKSTYDNLKSGYAGTGTIYAVDGAYFFSKHIGVGGLANYSRYGNKGLNQIANGYIDSYEYSKVKTDASHYKTASLLGGLYFNFPIGKLAITARTLAGIAHSKTPSIKLSTWGDDDTYDGDIEQQSASASSFALDGGLGLTYPIYKRFSVCLNADYFYSKPSFDIQNKGVNNPQADARVLTHYHQALAGVNLTAGITYALGK